MSFSSWPLPKKCISFVQHSHALLWVIHSFDSCTSGMASCQGRTTSERGGERTLNPDWGTNIFRCWRQCLGEGIYLQPKGCCYSQTNRSKETQVKWTMQWKGQFSPQHYGIKQSSEAMQYALADQMLHSLNLRLQHLLSQCITCRKFYCSKFRAKNNRILHNVVL